MYSKRQTQAWYMTAKCRAKQQVRGGMNEYDGQAPAALAASGPLDEGGLPGEEPGTQMALSQNGYGT